MVIRSYLYDRDGTDRQVELSGLNLRKLGSKQILWIDALDPSSSDREGIAASLSIDTAVIDRLLQADQDRHLDNYGDYFAFSVPAFTRHTYKKLSSEVGATTLLGFVVAKNWLLTTHVEDVEFLSAFQAQDKGETKIGGLEPALLAVSLLDWHLAEYFREVSRVEEVVDELDALILSDGTKREILSDIVANRRRVSNLRQLISDQRSLFHGLTRPDFAETFDSRISAQFAALAGRFDRAVDEVERGRNVVVGSFELFTSMTTQQTNDLVKSLTFLTAVIGMCAAVAGLLGMNFNIAFFNTGMAGFLTVVAGLSALAIALVFVARARRWI